MMKTITCLGAWSRRQPRQPAALFCGTLGALAIMSGAMQGGLAQAQGVEPPVSAQPRREAFCPARPIRWQDDCAGLQGQDLKGLQRLRYRPLNGQESLWLTLSGEARIRMDVLQDIDFGIGDQPGYVSTAGRLLVGADLRSRQGPRAFVQLGIVEENGRKPGPRAQDESQVDITQAFFDVPLQLGQTRMLARIGRQELDLSGNRLVNTRDGATLRRAFEGVGLDIAAGQARLKVASVRPMRLHDEAFADRADDTERFNVVSVDLPPSTVAGGSLNVFLLHRSRLGARYLRAQGAERRSTLGAHYARSIGDWRIDAQGAWQTGSVAGKPARAYGGAFQLDRDLGGTRGAALGFDIVVASGDKAGTATIETFDPVYPNNGGLSDAPLFFQTNYVFAGGNISARWAGVTWATGANLLARHSTHDAVYAGGRPIAAPFGTERLTSLLAQVSARRAIGRNGEIYASLVHAAALGSVRAVGGEDAFYSRIQMTTRF